MRKFSKKFVRNFHNVFIPIENVFSPENRIMNYCIMDLMGNELSWRREHLRLVNMFRRNYLYIIIIFFFFIRKNYYNVFYKLPGLIRIFEAYQLSPSVIHTERVFIFF